MCGHVAIQHPFGCRCFELHQLLQPQEQFQLRWIILPLIFLPLPCPVLSPSQTGLPSPLTKPRESHWEFQADERCISKHTIPACFGRSQRAWPAQIGDIAALFRSTSVCVSTIPFCAMVHVPLDMPLQRTPARRSTTSFSGPHSDESLITRFPIHPQS